MQRIEVYRKALNKSRGRGRERWEERFELENINRIERHLNIISFGKGTESVDRVNDSRVH